MADNVWIEIAGWAGAALVLAAYALLSAGRLTGKSAAYQTMNVMGATGFVINGWWHGAIPSAVMNLIWLTIGSLALCKIIWDFRTGHHPDEQELK